MLKALKLKLAIGTLAALAAVGAVALHQQRSAKTRKAKIEQQLKRYAEQAQSDDAEYRQQLEGEKFRKQVEEKKKRSNAYAGGESSTWTKH